MYEKSVLIKEEHGKIINSLKILLFSMAGSSSKEKLREAFVPVYLIDVIFVHLCHQWVRRVQFASFFLLQSVALFNESRN